MAKILLVSAIRKAFRAQDLHTSLLGGIETTNIELASRLAERGHEVVLGTPTTSATFYNGFKNVPLGDLQGETADIFISSNDLHAFDVAPQQAKKVLWVHNPLILERLFRRKQIRPLFQYRPHAVFVGEVSRRRTSRLLPFSQRSTIYHGVSDVFRNAAPSAGQKKIAVWVSQPQRGLKETLDIWTTHIFPRVPDAEFHIFGRVEDHLGPGMARFGEFGVIFHKRASMAELATFYRTARMMIFPGARDETFCLAAAEAQCVGLPVVTRGIGALSERVKHGVNGIIARTDIEVGAAAVRLFNDDELWSMLHQGALCERVTLDWRNAARMWEYELGVTP